MARPALPTEPDAGQRVQRAARCQACPVCDGAELPAELLWHAVFTRCFGLEYRFPARIALNGYPVFLSLLTVAYFATYFAVMSAGLRLVERLTGGLSPPLPDCSDYAGWA